jgi:hypothetical protein
VRFRWTLFGREVTTVELGGGEDQQIADLMAALSDKEIGGGSGHNFDRDFTPADPNDRYRWEDKFGFGRGPR